MTLGYEIKQSTAEGGHYRSREQPVQLVHLMHHKDYCNEQIALIRFRFFIRCGNLEQTPLTIK